MYVLGGRGAGGFRGRGNISFVETKRKIFLRNAI